jgi:REP element-mobilizing transposase RayT
MTVLDAIIQSLSRAGEYNRDDQVAPAVILWPDKERQWEPVLPVLRERLPHLLTLGPYAANCKTGPAIWLRCMISRTLPEANWSEKTTPILYLPGVSRQELRAVAECPPALMPLAELQYRGAFWSQVNHKDWTVLAFLQSADGGLGLDVARDTATLDAMKTALAKLVETDIQDLTGHKLEASDFHALLSPDPVREILAWLNDPKAAQAKLTAQQWEAFCHSCKDKFGFHPMKDGPLRAAEMMGLRQGNWSQVRDRFREAPKRYPNLPGWLRKAKPQDDDLFLKESDEVWPQSNEIHETALRNVLKGCAGKTAQVVMERIKESEAVHGKRRSWVWAELDQAPLAVALKHLAILGDTCGKPVAGGALDDVVVGYVNGGWCADAAVVDALGVVEKKDDIEAVQAVIRAVYLPWLEASALSFQKLVCGATVPVALRQARKPEACATFGQVLQQTVYFNPYEPIEISERNLPHWRQPNVTYFVTFRLVDALPAEKLAALKAEREAWIRDHPEPHGITDQEDYHRLFSERIQDWLDAGAGSCLLRDERVGAIVAGALRHFDGQRYALGSWVVMPNHVHAVVTPKEGWSLDQILHSWKSFTAHEINKLLGRSGSVWQHEGYDHIVRNPRALWKIEEYIADNPRKAGIHTEFVHSRLPEQGGATVSVAAPGKPEACPTLSDVAKGTAILFADGLRFDLAQKLKARLAEKGLQLEVGWRWTALPTVTPTAKPAASPISELFTGDEGCEEFRPRIKDGGKDLTSDRFKQLLEERGCQVLSDKKLGQPDGVAWLEYGSIDSTGHKEGWKLAKPGVGGAGGPPGGHCGPPGGRLEEGQGGDRPRLVAGARGPAQARPAQIPGRDALGPVCAHQRGRPERTAHGAVALGQHGACGGAARRRSFQGQPGIRPRRLERAGMPGAGADGQLRRAGRGRHCDFVGEVGWAAVPRPGQRRCRGIAGGHPGEHRRQGHVPGRQV